MPLSNPYLKLQVKIPRAVKIKWKKTQIFRPIAFCFITLMFIKKIGLYNIADNNPYTTAIKIPICASLLLKPEAYQKAKKTGRKLKPNAFK